MTAAPAFSEIFLLHVEINQKLPLSRGNFIDTEMFTFFSSYF
jgi:hypothetical protein